MSLFRSPSKAWCRIPKKTALMETTNHQGLARLEDNKSGYRLIPEPAPVPEEHEQSSMIVYQASLFLSMVTFEPVKKKLEPTVFCLTCTQGNSRFEQIKEGDRPEKVTAARQMNYFTS